MHLLLDSPTKQSRSLNPILTGGMYFELLINVEILYLLYLTTQWRIYESF